MIGNSNLLDSAMGSSNISHIQVFNEDDTLEGEW